MAAQLSSTGISHHNLLPYIPSNRFSIVNSSLCSGIAPQSLNSSSQLLHLHTSVPVQSMYGCSMDCLILILFRLPQVNCFTFSLKCLPFDSDNCPDLGIGPLLQFSHRPKAGPVLLTLLLFSLVPLSYQVSSTGSWKKQESSRKASISALLTMPKPLTVWITINCGKF